MKEKTINCPKCSKTFSKIKLRKLEHPSGALLDVCDRCGGMWIDAPEVKMLHDYKEPKNNLKIKSRGGKTK
ncbi:MAG: zf-TFIIB domain-containing protein [Candidatus Nanoarchaeia archaeon]